MSALERNWRVLRVALKADRQRRREHVVSADTTFLPAALEVTERPVSPTGRVTAWLLMGGLVATMLWLVIGRVDVVASASGRIVPAGNVKIVQSPGTGVVRAIHVKDGDKVVRGQVLIELDTTLSTADLEQARKGLLAAELDIARNQAIADALSGRGVRFQPPPGTPSDVVVTQRRLIEAQVAALESTAAGLSAARSSSLSEASAAAAQRAKLEATIPILDQELEAMNRLYAKGYAPGLRLLEMKRQRRSEAGDRDIAAAQEARGMSDARKFARQVQQVRQEARRVALADLAKAQAEAILRREEVTKAERRKGVQQLRAPESGTVQQRSIHTVGGVAEAARTLMVIVPGDGALAVEARLLNRDAGFVREGAPVNVKVEAFPFTRYGTIPGRVVSISRDAVPDPKLGATYLARIQLARSTIMVDGRPAPLSSGLGVVADIRTGSRRIVTYLLSPVQTSVAQAGRER